MPAPGKLYLVLLFLVGATLLLFLVNQIIIFRKLEVKINQQWSNPISQLIPSQADIVYSRRRIQFSQECSTLKSKSSKFAESQERLTAYKSLLLDNRHRVIYCPLPKTATTFLKRLIQLTSGVKKGQNIFGNISGSAHDDSIPHLRPGNQKNILKSYQKFLFVREPYARLLAAYIDKFWSAQFWYLGRDIIQKFRRNATKKALHCGHDVTFPEFIRYVIVTVSRGVRIDPHWKPMYKTCQPCLVNYDIVGKLETISDDLRYIFEKFNFTDSVKLDDMETESERDIVLRSTRIMYKREQECVGSGDMLKKILREQQIRGYISKNISVPDGIIVNGQVSRSDALRFMARAMLNSGERSERRKNRHEALIEAYTDVPLRDLHKLKDLYYPDFILSEYDPTPSELFENREEPLDRFYFPQTLTE